MLVAFGGPSVGKLVRNDHADVAAPVSGLSRLLDTASPDLQLPSDDQLAGWDPATGTMYPSYPRETPDLAFFVTPAIGDVDGDGIREVIAGNGVYTLSAVNALGAAHGWPKLTGGWLVGTPSLGDWDGDGRLELAVVRRDGVLLVVAHARHRPTGSTSGRDSGTTSPTRGAGRPIRSAIPDVATIGAASRTATPEAGEAWKSASVWSTPPKS